MREMHPSGDDVLSVGRCTALIRETLEGHFARLAVRGEISNLHPHGSGHIYFSLKDQEAQLAAVMYRQDALRLEAPLREGQMVVCYGRISVFDRRGIYQMVVRVVLPEGRGRLFAALEALKQRLLAEGLFASERKRPLPPLPRVVGIVTSPTGAALKDFLLVLRRRGWHGRVLIFPAQVQGKEAAPSILAALDKAARGSGLDLLVLARGGGSLEDLWAFNEEPVVRAVAAFPCPVISAIGHETDWVLTDFAADHRAETPTAAAEAIAAARATQLRRWEEACAGLLQTVEDRLARLAQEVDFAAQRWKAVSPAARVAHDRNRFLQLHARWQQAAAQAGRVARRRLEQWENRRAARHPGAVLALARARLEGLESRLQAAGPAAIFRRGFSFSTRPDGSPLTSAADLRPGDRMVTRFAAGSARSEILDTDPSGLQGWGGGAG